VSLAGVELPCGGHVPVSQLILGAPYRPEFWPALRVDTEALHHQLAGAGGQGAVGLDVGEEESVTALPSDLPLQARSWVNVLQGLHAGRGQFPGAGPGQ
jgi:hypothetical protein